MSNLNLTVTRHPTKKVWFLQPIVYYVCANGCLSCEGKFYWQDQDGQAWSQKQGQEPRIWYGFDDDINSSSILVYKSEIPAWLGTIDGSDPR